MELGRGNRSESRGATGLRRTCRALSVGALRARRGGGGWSSPSLSSGRSERSRRARLGFRRGCISCAPVKRRRVSSLCSCKTLRSSVDPHGTISPAILSALFPTEVPPNFWMIHSPFGGFCSSSAMFGARSALCESLDRVEAGKGEGYLRIRITAAAGC